LLLIAILYGKISTAYILCQAIVVTFYKTIEILQLKGAGGELSEI